jgi:hypothetical protein
MPVRPRSWGGGSRPRPDQNRMVRTETPLRSASWSIVSCSADMGHTVAGTLTYVTALL